MTSPASGAVLGQPAPRFALTALHGETVDLNMYRGRQNVVVWFSRGFTCPFCLRCRQLRPCRRDGRGRHLDARRPARRRQQELLAPAAPPRHRRARAGHLPRDGGHVAVSLAVEDGAVRVEVTDTGIGIPAADLPHVFDKFYRVKSRATEGIPGTGLGLAITRRIVETHGGRIWAESAPGVGSTFAFSLPRGPS